MSGAAGSGRGAAGRRLPLVLAVAAIESTARILLAPQLTALQECGYEVRLACAPDSDSFGADLSRFSPVDVRFPRSVRPARIVRAAMNLRTLINDLRPDILHLHTPAVALPARLLPRSLIAAETRIVYTVHGFAHVWDNPTLRNIALERIERSLAGRTDALLFQSREDLDEVRRRCYRTETVYLGNGVQPLWFKGPTERVSAETPRALFVGRLVREKGILDLLDALVCVPSLRLAIAGSQLPTDRGGVANEVARRIRQPPLAGRVELLGTIDAITMQEEITRCDFLVLPSYREGIPRSIIEGMASGRPAVVSDVRGCRELVRPGYNGFIFAPGDARAMAKALSKMMSLTNEQYSIMSQGAYALVDAEFREERVIERLVAAYAKIGVPPDPPPSTGLDHSLGS